MSCTDLTNALPRISARIGKVVDLDVSFYNNGVLADPYTIRYVEIYKSQILPHNLVAVVPVVEPDDADYPSPICKETVASTVGDCGTEPTSDLDTVTGKYHLPFSIPSEFTSPDVYFDVWYYFPTNPCSETVTCDIDSDDYADQLVKCCHRFWVFPDSWFCTDGLQTVNFAFEPMSQKFYSPEKRPLEVGLMPLPLYDYNINLVNPLIPFLSPTITVQTYHHELLVNNAPCTIGLRQGSYRSNPWVVKYMLDTTTFYKGTYQYYITLNLPDGTSRVSKKYIFTIS